MSKTRLVKVHVFRSGQNSALGSGMLSPPNLSLWIDFQNTQAIVQWHAWDFGPEKDGSEFHVAVSLASFKANPRNFMCLVLDLWLG
jgi:hypothetical protein